MAGKRKNNPESTNEKISRTLMEMERVLLGPRASYELYNDPKHLVFVLARYKFVSKMLSGSGSVLEVGCGDGLGTALVAAEGNRVTGLDADPAGIERAVDLPVMRERVGLVVHDILQAPYLDGDSLFDAAYSLDVIEHIPPEQEPLFLANIVRSLKPNTPLIIGTPNKDASEHASAEANEQHINLHTQESLAQALGGFFHNVFLFGMNDEVIHTGFAPMCHYAFALAIGPKPLTDAVKTAP